MAFKQNLFGRFIYKGVQTATSWNNRTVRVESAGGKTVHIFFLLCCCDLDLCNRGKGNLQLYRRKPIKSIVNMFISQVCNNVSYLTQAVKSCYNFLYMVPFSEPYCPTQLRKSQIYRTRWGPNKLADILPMAVQIQLAECNVDILINISLKFIHEGLIDNKLALFGHQIADNPLPEKY